MKDEYTRGDEQTMTYDGSEWLGEDGWTYIDKRRVFRLALKAFLVGGLVNAGAVILLTIIFLGVPI